MEADRTTTKLDIRRWWASFSLPPWGKGMAWVEDERNRAVCCCWLARDGHACGEGKEEDEVVAWLVARDPRPSLR